MRAGRGRLCRFDGKTWQSYNRAGQSEGVYSITLNPKENPKEIDLSIVRAKGGKILIRGIYVFEKDQLVVCWSSTRKQSVRPRDFTTAGGDDEFRIFVLERKKKT